MMQNYEILRDIFLPLSLSLSLSLFFPKVFLKSFLQLFLFLSSFFPFFLHRKGNVEVLIKRFVKVLQKINAFGG